MSALDFLLIAFYLVGVVIFGLYRRPAGNGTAVDYMLGGRRLTLPAFVATLVSNWYGGILGVGEYSFRYGISNWLVFGVPYYVAALLFAFLLAKKARRTEFITIPDRLNQCYGRHVAGFGAVIVFLWTLPGAYILILGVLGKTFFGVPQWVGIAVGTVLVTAYAYLGGFRSLVRADLWHFVFMYLGFFIMAAVLVSKYGGIEFLQQAIPETHFTWHGGNTFWFIAVWYVIALATLVEPSFYQVCYAARDEALARRGILVSIACWFVFDMLTTTCGLYARAILPSDIDPIASFPLLGQTVLPEGFAGLFAVAIFATVISTADSYLFISASTLGKDVISGWMGKGDALANYYTKWALVAGAAITVLIASFFESVISVWYSFGSVGTPMLLVPLVSTFIGKKRMHTLSVMLSMTISGAATLLWLLSSLWTSDGGYLWGVEPIFPGLFISLLFYFCLPGAKKKLAESQRRT